MRRLAKFILLWLCIPSAAPVAQAPEAALPREAFARGMELTSSTGSPVQTLLLPDSVYRGMTSAQLHDLRVFNADGEEVPHAVRTLIDVQPTDRESLELPLFAIHARQGEDILLGDMSLHLKRSEDGRVLEVAARNEAPSGNEPEVLPIVAYILDLGELTRPCVEVNLPLPEGLPSFISSYAVEASSDLSTWSTLVGQATLASLDHEGMRLERTSVPLPPTKRPYLRLRWLDDAPPLQLKTAELELQREAGVAKRRSVKLAGQKRADEPGVFDYPSPGPLPVNRVQVELPATNTLIQAEVKTAAAMQGRFRTLLNARFYRITNGVELRNDPHSVKTHSARHWSLAVAPQGGGVGQGIPQLELEYFPHQLAFVARGNGPFTLAFGKYGAEAASFNWKAVTEVLTSDQRTALPHESVTIGEVFNLAGDSALVAPVVDQRVQKFVLWAVLILGVVILGGFSWKLARKVA